LPHCRDWACEFRLCVDSRDVLLTPGELEGCRVCAVALGWVRVVDGWVRLLVLVAVALGVPACDLSTLSQPLPLLLLQLPESSFLYTVPSLPA